MRGGCVGQQRASEWSGGGFHLLQRPLLVLRRGVFLRPLRLPEGSRGRTRRGGGAETLQFGRVPSATVSAPLNSEPPTGRRAGEEETALPGGMAGRLGDAEEVHATPADRELACFMRGPSVEFDRRYSGRCLLAR